MRRSSFPLRLSVDEPSVNTISLHRNDLFSTTIRVAALHYGIFQHALLTNLVSTLSLSAKLIDFRIVEEVAQPIGFTTPMNADCGVRNNAVCAFLVKTSEDDIIS